MGSRYPFTFDDEEGRKAYLQRMYSYLNLQASNPSQLSVGSTFTLTLKAPSAPSSIEPSSGTMRLLPALPFGAETQYTLVEALQEGLGYKSQVWRAGLLGHSNVPPAVQVVFKFIIPSHGDIPDSDVSDQGIVDHRKFIFPIDMAEGEAKSYEALAEFQGSTLPYFYGLHEVMMPWNEPAWLLVYEWIPGPGSLWDVNRKLIPEGRTRYCDIELYKRLFQSAYNTLSKAHRKGIYHSDVRDANILIDEEYDQAVWIDWTLDHDISPENLSYLPRLEGHQLVVAFKSSESEQHVDEIEKLRKDMNIAHWVC